MWYCLFWFWNECGTFNKRQADWRKEHWKRLTQSSNTFWIKRKESELHTSTVYNWLIVNSTVHLSLFSDIRCICAYSFWLASVGWWKSYGWLNRAVKFLSTQIFSTAYKAFTYSYYSYWIVGYCVWPKKGLLSNTNAIFDFENLIWTIESNCSLKNEMTLDGIRYVVEQTPTNTKIQHPTVMNLTTICAWMQQPPRTKRSSISVDGWAAVLIECIFFYPNVFQFE